MIVKQPQPSSAGHPPEKWAVGEAAAALVQDDAVLGLGTGSTVAAFLDALQLRRARGDVSGLRGVPTSERTAARCRELGLALVSPADVTAIELCVDGADELTDELVLVKGGGGALLREKVVADMARRFVVIAGAEKLTTHLGDTFALPVEVVPFALEPVRRTLALWGDATVRIDARGSAVRTDNGNAILDLRVRGGIEDPAATAAALSAVPGVAEHGLFVGLATDAFLATADGQLRRLHRDSSA